MPFLFTFYLSSVTSVAKLIEAKSGEHAGKKYDEVRNYATLVTEIK